MNTLKTIAAAGVCVLFLTMSTNAWAEAGRRGRSESKRPTTRAYASPTDREEDEFARDYQQRRRAGDARNCPCASNPAAYCSCASHNGYYGWWGGGDRYQTSSGWSRSYWRGSDTPTTGYTPPTSR